MNNDREDLHAINARLNRFEDRHAVLMTEDNQSLTVSRTLLPADVKEGDALWLEIQTHHDREKNQKKMAKALLNEILNPEP